MKRIAFIVLCLTLSASTMLYAQSDASTPKQAGEITELQEKTGWAADKCVRGLTNILTGWVELINQPSQRAKQDGLAAGMTTGLGEGLIWTLLRTGAGVWDVVTWPGAMIIPDAKPVIDPPTVFDESTYPSYE